VARIPRDHKALCHWIKYFGWIYLDILGFTWIWLDEPGWRASGGNKQLLQVVVFWAALAAQLAQNSAKEA
jgi:hypothetical protein